MIRRAAAACVAVASFLGCEEPRSAEVEFEFLQTNRFVNVESVRIAFEDGLPPVLLTDREFETNADSALWITGRFDTALRGRLFVTVELIDPEIGFVASGQVSMPLRPDWLWTVSVDPARFDSTACPDCFGMDVFPLPPAFRERADDALWISWRGKGVEEKITS